MPENLIAPKPSIKAQLLKLKYNEKIAGNNTKSKNPRKLGKMNKIPQIVSFVFEKRFNK